MRVTPAASFARRSRVARLEHALAAERALAKQPTITKGLDRMVDQGPVARLEDAADRRRVYIRLTARGNRLAAELIPLAREHAARVRAG